MKLNAESYARKFTPRKDATRWSELNKKRLRRVIEEGRMTEPGLAVVGEGVFNEAPRPKEKKKEPELPEDLRKKLARNRTAFRNFNNLAPSYRKNYILWITTAKKEETRDKRLKEAIDLLERNLKLPLK